jgi:hypothetical protein
MLRASQDELCIIRGKVQIKLMKTFLFTVDNTFWLHLSTITASYNVIFQLLSSAENSANSTYFHDFYNQHINNYSKGSPQKIKLIEIFNSVFGKLVRLYFHFY